MINTIFDPEGNLFYTKGSNGTEKWYDKQGNVIRSRTKSGNEKFFYDDGSVKFSKTSTKSKTGIKRWSRKWYDANGQLVHNIQPLGDEYWYDSKGRLIHRLNAFNEKSWEFHENGQLKIEKTVYSYRSIMLLEYDANGNKIHSVEYGKECWWIYNERGLKIEKRCSDGSCVYWEYDDRVTKSPQKAMMAITRIGNTMKTTVLSLR